jgi:hypothetical protein
MSDQLLLEDEGGSVCVPAAALERLVARAAESVGGVRVRRPRRSLEITLEQAGARVSLELSARYGIVLPELAREVQATVADALETMCGLRVEAVDVTLEELR